MNKLEFYGDIIEVQLWTDKYMINSNVFSLSGWSSTGKITVGNILVQKKHILWGKRIYEIYWKWGDRRYRMFRIDEYINELIITLKDVLGGRLVYIGLQGSYLGNEETKSSDIWSDNKFTWDNCGFFICSAFYR